MTKVSKRYEVSDVALAKVWRKMDIPVPERGYWARVANGQKPNKQPLPKRSKDVSHLVDIHPIQRVQWKEAVELCPQMRSPWLTI